jgi:cytoskeleton protein RodZ
MSNFGASFRRARESAGLPLEKIAAETRISTRFLLAIESEDFHLLPGGVFNRGFVRAYAAHLGMDADQAVSEYSRISATSDEPLDVLRDVERASDRKAERNLYPVLAGILLLLIGAYYVATRGSASKPVDTATNTAQESAAPAPSTPSTPPLTSPSTPPNLAPEEAPTATTTTTAVPPPVQAEPAATTPFASLVLEVDVKELTWIRIATDGTVALNESISAGTVRRFSAERSIDVTLGNAGGTSMKINGRDMGQLGARGQVRQFKITPENALQIQG